MQQPSADPALYVSRFINQTNKNVFLTGKAGTGKTTLLRNIVSTTYKKCLIAAPTGIAAINAGGVTIHSLFQLPFGGFVPVKELNPVYNSVRLNDPVSVIKGLQMYDNKRKLLREMELLIIDEVSMLRADLLDAIDLVLRSIRKNNLPFGGVQVLFIGDMLQLPPVVKDDEWQVLRKYYDSLYFFDALVLKQDKPVYIELEKIYRQSDQEFLDLLNHLRDNEMSEADYTLLNKFYRPGYKHDPADGHITLTTHNQKAAELNRNFLGKLPGRSHFFEAVITGDFNESSYPTEKALELKTGAQVMFIKNDSSGGQRFFNGKIGFVNSINEEKIEVRFSDGSANVIVDRYEWQNVKYRVNEQNSEVEENIAGTFSHYPLKLAWAITVHKSQGLTFDNAIIDIGSAFAPGQVYVALSRLRSLKGLILTSSLNPGSLRLDQKISTYSRSRSGDDLGNILGNETYQFLRTSVSGSFDLGKLIRAVEEHTESYTKKDEKRSVKQRYHEWAKTLEKDLKALRAPAENFRTQIRNILGAKEDGHMEFLYQRLGAAEDYFLPFIGEHSSRILKHTLELKKESRTREYIAELLELEAMFHEQGKNICKAGLIIRATIDKKEIDAADIKKLGKSALREEQLIQLFSASEPGAGIKSKKERKPRKERIPKAEKKDTKEESFRLYKEGNDIAAIAKERGMAVTTIEGHLAHFITTGKISSAAFISGEKKEAVIAASKALGTLQAGPIKQALGEEYSYSDIRYAIAAHLSES
ncbi:MAG: helix-turn-helix domain-containing protein [Bacteroidia bacterium]